MCGFFFSEAHLYTHTHTHTYIYIYIYLFKNGNNKISCSASPIFTHTHIAKTNSANFYICLWRHSAASEYPNNPQQHLCLLHSLQSICVSNLVGAARYAVSLSLPVRICINKYSFKPSIYISPNNQISLRHSKCSSVASQRCICVLKKRTRRCVCSVLSLEAWGIRYEIL